MRNNKKAVKLHLPYNHDIDVSEALVADYPRIAGLIRDEALIAAFSQYDLIAKAHKDRMLLLGRIAITLTLVALLGVVVEMLAAGLHYHFPLSVTVVIELLALAALGTLALDHVQHNRAKYVLACFGRERLRQWHFQLFLDGPFVESFARDNIAGKKELTRRFKVIVEVLRGSDGALNDYMDALISRKSLLHEEASYEDRDKARSALAALKVLRLDHQAQYPRRKIAHEANDQHVSMREQHDWVEAIGKVSLLLAVAIPAAQVLLALLRMLGVIEADLSTAHTSLFAAAIGLTVLSATARAYCVGMALPDELESYERYTSHVDSLRAVFEATDDVEQKRQCLVEMELEAERELQRFIRIKRRASFLA